MRADKTMPIDNDVLRLALSQLQTRRHRDAAVLLERRRGVYEELPALRALDGALYGTMLKLLQLPKDDDAIEWQLAALRDENLKLQSERTALLIENGYPADYLDEIIQCRDCRDTGYSGSRLCDCLLQLCAAEGKKRVSYLLDLKEQTFERFRLDLYSDTPDDQHPISPKKNASRALSSCRIYAESFTEKSGNLLMSGSPGLGKTFLSAAIAGVVASKGYSVVYDSVPTVIAEMESEKFDRRNKSDGSYRYENCDLLILDDLGAEMQTPFSLSALYVIINGRIIENRATVINTNLTMDELVKRYGPALSSRLRGMYQIILFFGEDIRPLLARENETGKGRRNEDINY
jgi:DNA replication protein DnaC